MNRLTFRSKRLPVANPVGLFAVRFSYCSPVYLTVYLLRDRYFVVIAGRHIPVISDDGHIYKAVEIHTLNLPKRLYRALVRANICLIEEVRTYLRGARVSLRGLGPYSRDCLASATEAWTPLVPVAPA